MQKAIEVKNLVKKYGDITAVNGISFTVEPGQTTALLGGNGAGKTTTISMLLGLLIPTAGEISIFGEDMLRHRFRILPRMNFSSPYIDLPSRLRVIENLKIFAQLYGMKNANERIADLARDLDLEDMLTRKVGALSAGQKTRVMMAKSLLNEPDLLLMDEPTASLDPDTADWVRSYLEKYQERTGCTFLLASHNMSEVERMCDNVLMMKSGVIVDSGSPDSLITKYGRDTLEEVFLHIARRHKEEAA
jgi:ABC-2 type transport system ATP-binding protein